MTANIRWHHSDQIKNLSIHSGPPKSNVCRALENILEHGEPGVHQFGNSVYQVGQQEGGPGEVEMDSGSDSYSEEESGTQQQQHFPTQHPR